MHETKWLRVSLKVDGELAEAVSEVLSRFVPGGVVIESDGFEANGLQHLSGTRMVVYAFLPHDDQLERKKKKLEEALYYLGRIQSLPDPEYEYVFDRDWAEAWKQHYKPIPIGDQLVIVPQWVEAHPFKGRQEVVMDPGMAFGTGTHPSTQMCLMFIEELLRLAQPGRIDHPGKTPHPANMIDVGCGSGILSLAGLKLGLEQALGVDTDLAAVKIACQNAEENQLSDRFYAHQGSVGDILEGKFELGRADIVTANIVADVIIELVGTGLPELVKPGGYLILAGIIDTQAGRVKGCLEAEDLVLLEERHTSDWIALCLQKPEN
jgi:ribosomal protein L11 methyltransferase